MAGHGRAVQQSPTHLSRQADRQAGVLTLPTGLIKISRFDGRTGVLHHEASFLLRYLDICDLGKDTSYIIYRLSWRFECALSYIRVFVKVGRASARLIGLEKSPRAKRALIRLFRE